MPKQKKVVTKKSSVWSRLLGWLRKHKLDAAIVSVLLFVSCAVSAINMSSYPQRFEDEGTYVSQSWAIQEKGQLTHYTYWYDHPPLGWIQMAMYSMSTDAIDRHDSKTISAGREYMLVLHLATIVLLYILARRLKIGSIAAGIGALAYALSPLAVEFSRYVLLDNVALFWFLLAFILALSPKRHLTTAIGSAACMAVAILSKETFAALLPVVLYALWTTGDKRNRRFTLTAFSVVFVLLSAFYLLYAVLKSELFPGEGHVSLFGTVAWQIFGREGSGSILESDSGARDLLRYWLNIDYWLLAAGTLALPFAFIWRNLRTAALALLIGILLMMRTGYLPYPHVITLLPFAALTFAGVLHYLVIAPWKQHSHLLRRVFAGVLAVAFVATTVFFVLPDWQPKLDAITSIDQDASSRQAITWIKENISRNNRLVVESALWADLQDQGFNQPDPVWLYKTETDPAITKRLGGWQGIDYVILNGPTIGSKDFSTNFPTASQAIENSKLVASFGEDNQKIMIFEVDNDN